MEDLVVKGRLLDFYGILLTERQRYCMEQHYENDLSLAEIAEDLGVSRQAVHDNLQRAAQLLNDYEAKLQLLAQETKREEIIQSIQQVLQQPNMSPQDIQLLLEQL